MGLVGGLLLSTRDNGGPDESSANPPATAVAPPTTARPTAEEIAAAIEVVETGFTTGQVVACDSDAHGETTCPPEERQELGEQVSYAAIIENTSDQVITGLTVNDPIKHRKRPIAHLAAGFATAVVMATTVVVVATDDGTGAVRVVEVGYSPAADPASGAEGVTWGAVVENTTGKIAVETTLVVEALDDSGDVVDEDQHIVEVLLPGQRLGIGPGGGLWETTATDEVRVRVDETASWEDPDRAPDVVSDVSVGYTQQNQPVVRFTVTFGDDRPAPQGHLAYAIFRDPQGHIIGGARSTSLAQPPIEPQRRVTEHIITELVVDGLETAEVYVDLYDPIE